MNCVTPTPLQDVLGEFLAAFQHARERLDERSLEAFLEIAATKVAREHAKRIDRERRRDT